LEWWQDQNGEALTFTAKKAFLKAEEGYDERFFFPQTQNTFDIPLGL